MKSFSIHIDTSIWSEKTLAEKGYCYISIKTEKGFFPEEKWADFAVAMMIEWIANFIDLVVEEQEDKNQLIFMEGPFIGNMERDGNTVSLLLSEYSINRDYQEVHEIYHKLCISITDLYNELTKVTNHLTKTIEQNQYDVKEADLLKRTYNKLKTLNLSAQ